MQFSTRYSAVILAFMLGACVSFLLKFCLSSDMPPHLSSCPKSTTSVPTPEHQFIAADQRLQTRCEAVVNRFAQGWSQVGQDWILFHNIFRNRSAGGVYVDIGANHARDNSNTFFFDRCLGWTGVCVEPNPQYWPSYAERSCTLVKKCVSDVRRNVSFKFEGVGGHVDAAAADAVVSEATTNTECITLEQLLDDFKLQEIDLISLDVEGHEINILSRFNFTKYQIEVWTVETFWLNTRIFDRLMHKGGYNKLTGIHIDDVYIRRSPLLYPPDWDSNERLNDRFRREALPTLLSQPVFGK